VLLTSANGARALAEASETRSKPVFAVGDVTARTAEALGFGNVASAGGNVAALADLVSERLKPEDGPLLHVSGVVVAGDLAGALAANGFDVRRFALYDAREVSALPDSARRALEARALDVAAFFSPRAAALFARLVGEAGLAQACAAVTAVTISPAATEPLAALPFKATLAAAQPTRQAVLDVIDRLGEAGYQGAEPERPTMSDTPPATSLPSPPPRPVVVRRGLGLLGAFVTGLIAAVIVLGGAVASLPYWPEEARALWLGGKETSTAEAERAAAETALRARVVAEVQGKLAAELAAAKAAQEQEFAKRRAEAISQQAANDAAKRELEGRLDDLDKRVRAAATTAAQADRPAATDPALNELRARITALESRPSDADTVKEVGVLKSEIANLRKALDAAAAKAESDAKTLSTGEAKALAAARASALIGIAARLSTALEQGQPFAADFALLAPFAQDDPKLAELSARLKPLGDKGVATRAALAADFPALARTALAQVGEGDSFGERLIAKLKGLVSIRRIGADVPGDTTEAKLARAEAALNAGDLARAVELVKSLPAKSENVAAAWLGRAEARLVAQSAVEQLSAHAVALLGAARQAP
jgi:uroporphyrinogen-III synthase